MLRQVKKRKHAELPDEVYFDTKEENASRHKRAKVHSEHIESSTETYSQEEQNTDTKYITVKFKHVELSVEGLIEKKRWRQIMADETHSETAIEDSSADEEMQEANNDKYHGLTKNKAFMSGYRAGGWMAKKGKHFDLQTPEDQALYDQGHTHALETISEETRNFNRGCRLGTSDAARNADKKNINKLKKAAKRYGIKHFDSFDAGYHKSYDTYVSNHAAQLMDDKNEDSQSGPLEALPSRAKVSGGGMFGSSITSSTSAIEQQPVSSNHLDQEDVARVLSDFLPYSVGPK